MAQLGAFQVGLLGFLEVDLLQGQEASSTPLGFGVWGLGFGVYRAFLQDWGVRFRIWALLYKACGSDQTLCHLFPGLENQTVEGRKSIPAMRG